MRKAIAWPPRVRSPAGVRLRAAGFGSGGGARGSSLEGTSGAGSRSGKRGVQVMCDLGARRLGCLHVVLPLSCISPLISSSVPFCLRSSRYVASCLNRYHSLVFPPLC